MPYQEGKIYDSQIVSVLQIYGNLYYSVNYALLYWLYITK